MYFVLAESYKTLALLPIFLAYFTEGNNTRFTQCPSYF